MYLDPVRFILIGDRVEAAKYEHFARKMLFSLARKVADSGVSIASDAIEFSSGTTIEVSLAGLEAIATIDVTGGKIQQLCAFFTSNTLVHIWNVDQKREIRALTGLPWSKVMDCDVTGRFLFLGSVGASPAAFMRLDTVALSALGNTPSVNTTADDPPDTVEPGIAAQTDDGLLNVQGTRLVAHFSGSGVGSGPDTLTLREGVGGLLVLNAETLIPMRPPIRMCWEPVPFVWSRDGERFFAGTCMNIDTGDITAGHQLEDLTESLNDYVSVFDKDGTLIGSILLSTWLFTPNSGFGRMIKGMATSIDGKNLYVTVDGFLAWTGATRTLYVLDATSNSLDILATYDLSSYSTVAPSVLSVSRDGKRLTMADGDSVIEFALNGEHNVDYLYTMTEPEFETFSPTRNAANDIIQHGPARLEGLSADDRRFFFNTQPADVTFLRGYNEFNRPHVLELDLTGKGFGSSYRLFNAMVTPVIKADPDGRQRLQ